MKHLYSDFWMVENALQGWLEQWKKTNWQHRSESIRAAELWQDIAAQVEKFGVKVHLVDAHRPNNLVC